MKTLKSPLEINSPLPPPPLMRRHSLWTAPYFKLQMQTEAVVLSLFQCSIGGTSDPM